MSVDLSVIWVVGLLVLGSFPTLNHERPAIRILLLSWSYFGLLIVAVYSSKLVSHLSIELHEKPLDTIEDIVKAGMYWGMDYEVPKDDIFNPNDPWAFTLLNRLKMEETSRDRGDRLREGGYAILGTRLNGKNFYEGVDIEPEMLYSMRGMKQCLNKFNIAFALPKLSPLTQPFSNVILRYVESGLTIYWHRDVTSRLSSPALQSMSLDKNYDDQKEVLKAFSLVNLGGIFLLGLVGHIIAICTFCIELAWGQYRVVKFSRKKLVIIDRRLQTRIRQLKHSKIHTTHMLELANGQDYHASVGNS